MLTPEGNNANGIDRIMLLNMWAINEATSKVNIIFAGMGKPTYPANPVMLEAQIKYWQSLLARVIQKLTLLSCANPSVENQAELLGSVAIDYGDPQGDADPREMMANAMSKWYKFKIDKSNILFTVGGAGALHIIFNALHELYGDIYPAYRIITPVPYYTLYKNKHHELHTIDVMKEPGYKLTAETLRESIREAYELAESDKKPPKAILICNPNNPLGTIIDEEELIKIAAVLKDYPDLHLIFDEAYAEMTFRKMPLLLEITPELANKMIIIRSATKGLSAAGEREAVILSLDKNIMPTLLSANIEAIGHAPRSSQLAYATTMLEFNEKDNQLAIDYYKNKVDYVLARVKEMGAELPDKNYKVEGTFYALIDLKDTFVLNIPKEAELALGYAGKIKTDEEITYSLLFQDNLMIAPLSYYGLDPALGFMRITCSAEIEQLTELMDRIEQRLLDARIIINQNLQATIETKLNALEALLPNTSESSLELPFKPLSEAVNKDSFNALRTTFKGLIDNSLNKNCGNLKVQNEAMKELLSKINVATASATADGQLQSLIKIQSLFRVKMARNSKKEALKQHHAKWDEFIEAQYGMLSPEAKVSFLRMSIEDRMKFPGFKEWRDKQNPESSYKPK